MARPGRRAKHKIDIPIEKGRRRSGGPLRLWKAEAHRLPGGAPKTNYETCETGSAF